VSTKTKIAILWASLLAAALVALVFAFQIKSRFYAEEQARLTQQAARIGSSYVEFSSQVIKQADALLISVRQFHKRSGSAIETEQFIHGLGFDESVIDNLYLIDEQGRNLLSHDPAKQNNSTHDRDFVQTLSSTIADTLYLSSVEKEQVTGKLHFRIARRISKPDGSFGGLVLATMQPDAFANYFERIGDSNLSVVSMLGSEDHRVRARIPRLADDQWDIQVASPVWAQLEQTQQGTFETRNAMDGLEREGFYQKIKGLPLVIVVGFGTADVQKLTGARFQLYLLTGLAALIFVLMLSITLTIVLLDRERIAQSHLQLSELNKQVRDQAMFDALTGLPSRHSFFEFFARDLSMARRNNRSVALLFLDLDGFKRVNDVLGHACGDEVLKTVANRWRSLVRATDTVARLGGDEFAIIIADLEDHLALHSIGAKLIQALNEDIALSEGRFAHVGVSIGAAIYPNNALEMDTLLAVADDAMYRSKQNGKNMLSISDAVVSDSAGAAAWLAFSNAHLVGVQEIDDQHRQLVQMVNRINQSIVKKFEATLIEAAFQELLDFTRLHFATEQRLMLKHGYAESDAHQHEHTQLLHKLGDLATQADQGNDLLILQTIKDWLVSHIQHADKPLGAFLVAQGVH
jgi:diguanylate cyclase (GGDEF)-like protein/hemerythrin-like metal-binding protein